MVNKSKIWVFVMFICGIHASFSQNNVSLVDTVNAKLYIAKDLDTTYRTFKNTEIRFLPPKHFVEFSSEERSGYMHTGTAANIVAAEYQQTPYLITSDTLKQHHLDNQDAQLFGQQMVKTHSGYPGKLYFARFYVDGISIIRIMFFTGDYNRTVFIQANYPEVFDPLIRQVLIQSLLSVEFK
jgi:hypothetical protein